MTEGFGTKFLLCECPTCTCNLRKHFKAFCKQNAAYLAGLALAFAATIVGIVALRSIIDNIAHPAQERPSWEEDVTWDLPDTTVQNPVTDLPITTPQPTSKPAAASSSGASSSAAASRSGASSAAPAATPAPSAPCAVWSDAPWNAEPIFAYSGDTLVYHETLADWRTHNGADYACAAGGAVPAVKAGTVAAVYEDALWGGVVEVTDQTGLTWRYCGVTDPAVRTGENLDAGTTLGRVGEVPTERRSDPHVHLECVTEGEYRDPETCKAAG